MRLPPLASLSLLLLTSPAVCAQSADDFFHGGAQFYISNNIAKARETVDGGRKLYPDDIKLKKLDALLKQQSQQQQSQNNQSPQNQQDQSQQQRNSGGQQKQQKQQPSQQNQQPQQNQKAQNQSGRQQQEQPQAQSSSGQPQEKPGEKENAEPPATISAHALTPQEAQQLLDAQKGNEQFLTLRPQGKPENGRRPVKDW